MKNRKIHFGLILWISLLFGILSQSTVRAQAILRLPSIIGDHMVLQQNSKVHIWGWSEPRMSVTVTVPWSETPVTTKAGVDTRWEVEIQTPAASGPYTISIKTPRKEIKIQDVLIGEVWLCSGQSNMNWSASNGILDMKEELPKISNSQIRFFTPTRLCAPFPQEDCHGEWKVCDIQSAKWFSAVGYFFGRRLYDVLQRPIGLINASWGGTPAEIWTPAEKITSDRKLLNGWKGLTKWNGTRVVPGSAYNGMLYPIRLYQLAGVIWYQGEDNVNTANTYAPLLQTMISSWREEFQNPDMPFYLVQIAPYARYRSPIINGAAILREQQVIVANTVANTGLVAIPDLVDNINDIHPRYKREVGARLANWALGEIYGIKGLKYRHPQYKSIKIEGKKIRVYFDNIDQGLISKNGKPATLQIAGKDMQFYDAEGTINPKDNSLVVSSPRVDDPVAVRYSFSDGAIGNLFDANGLPVIPFRSDTPATTESTSQNRAGNVFSGTISTIEIKVKGDGYDTRYFENGAILFTNRPYPITNTPDIFDGFEFLASAVPAKGLPTNGGEIIPLDDGNVYIAARRNATNLKILNGWTEVKNSKFQFTTGKSTGELFIFTKTVKKGDRIQIPVTTDYVGIIPMAKSIKY